MRVGIVFFIATATPACASAGRASYDAMSADYRTFEAELRRSKPVDDRALRGPQLERRALIRAVLDRNPSVESARQAWRAALAHYRQAGAYEDPMIMASFAPLSIASREVRFGFEVELSQRIPLGSKLDAQAALAAAEAQAANSGYESARLQLALTASQLFDDYFAAVRSLQIQAQHVALMTALKQNAIVAYESGHATVQDSLRADAELARLEYQRTVYESDRDVAIAQLNALLHRAPDAPLPPPPAELPPNDEQSTPVPNDLSTALKQRPDVASARAKVRVASASVAAADSAYSPDLTLSTSYSSMWDMPQHRWMAGVSLNVPLQREARSGALDEARAMESAAHHEAEGMADTARAEVAVAQRRRAAAVQAVALYEQRLLPVARDRIEAARASLMTSQTSFMAAIEAERELRAVELELETARADLSRRSAELAAALGRVPGFSAREAKP